MSVIRYRGLLVVALWQAAPSPVAVDSTGRIQGFLGFGGGQYESVSRACDGSVLSASAVRFSGVGTRIDAWPTRSVRVTGMVGALSADRAEWSGGYYGAMTALELQRFGIGLGAVRAPSDETWPAIYLRAGNRDAIHFVLDVSPPTPPLAAAGAVRLAVGANRGHLRGFSFLAGTALCHARCDGEGNAALFGETRFPVHTSFDLEFRALVGPGEDYINTGLSVGGRFHFGR